MTVPLSSVNSIRIRSLLGHARWPDPGAVQRPIPIDRLIGGCQRFDHGFDSRSRISSSVQPYFSRTFSTVRVRPSRVADLGDYYYAPGRSWLGTSAAARAGPPHTSSDGRPAFSSRPCSSHFRHRTLVTRPAFSTPSELQTRTEYSTIQRTQTHRTEGPSFESTTTSPLWIPFVSPHTMRGVHEPHSYFSVPSHDVHSRTPLSP